MLLYYQHPWNQDALRARFIAYILSTLQFGLMTQLASNFLRFYTFVFINVRKKNDITTSFGNVKSKCANILFSMSSLLARKASLAHIDLYQNTIISSNEHGYVLQK